jgi:hypothetical protein
LLQFFSASAQTRQAWTDCIKQQTIHFTIRSVLQVFLAVPDKRKLQAAPITQALDQQYHSMGGDNRAKLYDAVGQIWLELYGGHVHVGKQCCCRATAATVRQQIADVFTTWLAVYCYQTLRYVSYALLFNRSMHTAASSELSLNPRVTTVGQQ